MLRARDGDVEAGPADPRMAAYLDGTHHPQKALPPRTAFVSLHAESVTGYVGGHESRRYNCDAELQYLYVVPALRRQGVGSYMLRLLASWFIERDLRQVCVGVDEENWIAREFLSKPRSGRQQQLLPSVARHWHRLVTIPLAKTPHSSGSDRT